MTKEDIERQIREECARYEESLRRENRILQEYAQKVDEYFEVKKKWLAEQRAKDPLPKDNIIEPKLVKPGEDGGMGKARLNLKGPFLEGNEK